MFDNTAVNLACFLIVLHECFGFGYQRCKLAVAAFYQRREEYNHTFEKEGKFTAECYLKKDLQGAIGDNWRDLFTAKPGE